MDAVLVYLNIEERKLSITIPPGTPSCLMGRVEIPKGEVWRIIQIVALNRPSPDVELSLQINGIPQARVTASCVYVENRSKPTEDAFANFVLGHVDKVHFVATPLTRPKGELSVVFLLKIQKEELI